MTELKTQAGGTTVESEGPQANGDDPHRIARRRFLKTALAAAWATPVILTVRATPALACGSLGQTCPASGCCVVVPPLTCCGALTAFPNTCRYPPGGGPAGGCTGNAKGNCCSNSCEGQTKVCT